jgi:hypothetical protein
MSINRNAYPLSNVCAVVIRLTGEDISIMMPTCGEL